MHRLGTDFGLSHTRWEGTAMRTSLLLALFLAVAASADAVTPSTDQVFRYEQRPIHPYQSSGVPFRGDTVRDPFIIDALPFSAAGGTCGFNNDYDYACPYVGSTSPDVVFKWVAVAGPSNAIEIDLCNSIYDTKVYVYENAVGIPIACNDDYCAYQSHLSMVPVAVGTTYYIVIDGYGGSCGTYSMDVDWDYPCVVKCPAGAMPEGEPDCYDGYNDTYNAGCNSTPFPVFQIIEPSYNPIVICGTTGVYYVGSWLYRDHDWFELRLSASSNICLAGDSEIPSYFYIIDGRYGCAGFQIMANAIVGPCAPMSGLCWYCAPVTWWMWAGPSAWNTDYLCGSTYWIQITGYYGRGVSPAGDTTWGGIKRLFQ
jgi:hypothetical protein